MYILLVKVFSSKFAKKWWPYFLLGWGKLKTLIVLFNQLLLTLGITNYYIYLQNHHVTHIIRLSKLILLLYYCSKVCI